LKLHRALVDHIAQQIARGLAREGSAVAEDRVRVSETVAAAISDDLMVEDRLNEEVREIMQQHAEEMTRRGIQYHDMFKMIKQELVRKRKLIL
jgi:hypothetical protein